MNIGSGEDVTIRQFSELVTQVVGFAGEIVFDTSKPDGVTKKVSDLSRLAALEWTEQTKLQVGLNLAYQQYVRSRMPLKLDVFLA